MAHIQSALLLTVGTGDVEWPEETLLTPLRKSIKKGAWARVVLLPSQLTAPSAEKLRDALPSDVFDVQPLPKNGSENDADECFSHFDAVIERLLEDGFDPLRRVAQRQFEDALLRVWELIGQIRLASHGLLSEALDERHRAVKEAIQCAELRSCTLLDARPHADVHGAILGSVHLSRSPLGRLQVGRESCSHLLYHLGDPFTLKTAPHHFDWLEPRMRHESILVHGYAAMGAKDVDAFQRLLRGFEDLLAEEAPGNRDRIRLAHHDWLD